MQRQPVDGVIVVLEERISDFVGYKPPREFPVVLICESAADHCPTVDADQYGCSTAIVDYLMSKGHNDRLPHCRTVHLARRRKPRPRLARSVGTNGSTRTEHVHRRLVRGFRLPAGVALAHDPDCTAI